MEQIVKKISGIRLKHVLFGEATKQQQSNFDPCKIWNWKQLWGPIAWPCANCLILGAYKKNWWRKIIEINHINHCINEDKTFIGVLSFSAHIFSLFYKPADCFFVKVRKSDSIAHCIISSRFPCKNEVSTYRGFSNEEGWALLSLNNVCNL